MVQKTADIYNAPAPAQLVLTDNGNVFLHLTQGWNNSVETIRRCLPRGWRFARVTMGPRAERPRAATCVAFLGDERAQSTTYGTAVVRPACKGQRATTQFGFGHWYCFPVERVE